MRKILILLALVLPLALAACDGDEVITSGDNEYVDPTVGENANTDEEINEELDLVFEEIDESEIDFDSFDFDENEYTTLLSSEETIYITEAGSYLLEGDYTTAIVINTPDEDVNLVLNNATITTTDGPCIIVLDADDVTISAVEDTENTLTDSETYTAVYGEEEVDAVIYSTSDLELNGSGSLTVIANYNNAIHTKDDIKISELTLNITSVDDGIIGKDYVAIKEAVINIVCHGDAIKSTNEEATDKGFIYIESGVFNIETENDGIKAVNDIIIYDGTFNLDTIYSGIESDASVYLGNGTYNITTFFDAINAGDELVVYNGDYTINAKDDALHADNSLTIDGGTILIESSYEGIEAYEIYINGGNIIVNSTDDGINATTGGGQVHGTGYVSTGGYLEITGGIIQVNALTGDGVDINGSGVMSGGYLIIYGTSADNQAAIDYDDSFEISGGSVISIGSTGMILGFSQNSTQASILYADSESYGSGTTITLLDSDGNTLLETDAIRSFTGVVLSTEDLTMNNSYTLNIGSESYEFEVTSIVTSIGDGGSTMTPPTGPGRR